MLVRGREHDAVRRDMRPTSRRAVWSAKPDAQSLIDDSRSNALNPTELAERYFECMRGRDLDGLCALFADNAVVVLPDGRELAGLAAIRGMYQHIFATGAPTPAPQATIGGANGVAVEIETRLGDGSSRRTANFFHLEGGRIARLSIYQRG
jgi:hypothetical protein